VQYGISSNVITWIILLNIILIVLNQRCNKSSLFFAGGKIRFYEEKYPKSKQGKKKIFENFFLEIVATLYVGSLIFFCFWILFKK